MFLTKRLGLSDNAIRRIAQMFDDDYGSEYDQEPMAEPMMPPMIPVQSSNVEEFGYDENSQTLYVRFLGKGNNPSSLYAYYEVPYDEYLAFFDSPSKGRFIWTNLRDRYSYNRIE